MKKSLMVLLFILVGSLSVFAEQELNKCTVLDSVSALGDTVWSDWRQVNGNTWRIKGTEDDTSDFYSKAEAFDEIAIWYKTTDTVGSDSVQIYIVLTYS